MPFPVLTNDLIIIEKYKGEIPKVHRKENGVKVVVREGPILARVSSVVFKDGVGSRGRTIGSGPLCTFSDVYTGFTRSYYLDSAVWEKAGVWLRMKNRFRELFIGLSNASRSISKRFEL